MGHLVGQARPPYAALPSKRSQRQATALTERKEVGDDGACRSVGSQGGGRSERASERDGRQLVRCNSHPAARAARTLEVGGSGCRRRRRVVRSYDAAATTLYAAKGRRIPFNVTSPAASTLTTCSTAISTRGLIKICPGFASSSAVVTFNTSVRLVDHRCCCFDAGLFRFCLPIVSTTSEAKGHFIGRYLQRLGFTASRSGLTYERTSE